MACAVASVGLSWASPAAAAPVANSGVSVVEARDIRERAEQKVADLEAEKQDLDARRNATTVDSANIAAELADARTSMRDRAVDAYVGATSDEALRQFFDVDDASDSTDRKVILRSTHGDAADDAARYRRLKADTDPQLVELADDIDDLESRLADATDALLQAQAVEGDAERQAERDARAAAEAVAAREAAAAAASAEPSTPDTRPAPRPAAAPTPSSAPATAADPTTTSSSPAPLPEAPPGGPTEEQWAKLRQCESGGNYRAVSANGKYRGAYQFDYRTWENLGGVGDPAAAPPAEQDVRAKMLYAQRGAKPWPTCGKYLR